jgi:hypothetical protein
MKWWGRVKDLPQAEGYKKPKAVRPKQGHKKPQKQMENNRRTRRKPRKRKGRSTGTKASSK